jgi:hypothetical protein
MAIVRVSLNPTKTGEFVARKVIPKDAREEYKRLYRRKPRSDPKNPCWHAESSGQSSAWAVVGRG